MTTKVSSTETVVLPRKGVYGSFLLLTGMMLYQGA